MTRALMYPPPMVRADEPANQTHHWKGPNVKFTLTYDGELKSNGGTREKWAIRKALHPQLEELWQIDPTLQRVERDRMWAKGGNWIVDQHHTEEPHPPGDLTDLKLEFIDLCAPIEKGRCKFVPLVRDSYLLTCGLKILFLRKEPPGRLYQGGYQGGDLDNRLKTLFDALSVPRHAEQVVQDPDAPDPMYTLLEDDGAITKVEIETHRLLTRPGANTHEVRLVIEVDVRISASRTYNQVFLGT
jgi:hypothetical protein